MRHQLLALAVLALACEQPDRTLAALYSKEPDMLPTCAELDQQNQSRPSMGLPHIQFAPGPALDEDEFVSYEYRSHEVAVTPVFRYQRLSCQGFAVGGSEHVAKRGEATRDPHVCRVTTHHTRRHAQRPAARLHRFLRCFYSPTIPASPLFFTRRPCESEGKSV